MYLVQDWYQYIGILINQGFSLGQSLANFLFDKRYIQIFTKNGIKHYGIVGCGLVLCRLLNIYKISRKIRKTKEEKNM